MWQGGFMGLVRILTGEFFYNNLDLVKLDTIISEQQLKFGISIQHLPEQPLHLNLVNTGILFYFLSTLTSAPNRLYDRLNQNCLIDPRLIKSE